MADFVVRNGTVVDGTGRPPFAGDVAVRDGVIFAVGPELAVRGTREFDARGKLVTPGWVDCHTHFDGQITWDPYCSPISGNGVTTIVFGNCGIGFAPCPKEQRQFLIELCEGVEDIPGAALSEGIQWNWETFPEFLDYLAGRPCAVDFGALVPHAAVRTFVMGLRGAEHAPAGGETVADPVTAEDVEAMASVVDEAVRAGAMGFSCSRSVVHRDIRGNVVPGSFACKAEVDALAAAVARAGGGVFETTSDFCEHLDSDPDGNEEMLMLRDIALRHPNVPVTFSLQENVQARHSREKYMEMLGWLEEASAKGAECYAQVSSKAVSFLMSLRSQVNPFIWHPTFQAIRKAAKTHEELVSLLRQPEVRARLVAEHDSVVSRSERKPDGSKDLILNFRNKFAWRADYEPDLDTDSIAALAQREGRHAAEVALDVLLADGGEGVLVNFLTNYAWGSLETTKAMMKHPQVVLGLGDGGAHAGFLTDAANCTFLLSHWARDRSRGSGGLPLELLVRKQTSETARLFGMRDRGTLEAGMKADLNVIDLDALRLERPRVVADLPLGAKRWVQDVRGYELTMLSGVVTFEGGRPTGHLPGRLVRNPRSEAARAPGAAPAAAVDGERLRSLRGKASTELTGEVVNSFQRASRL